MIMVVYPQSVRSGKVYQCGWGWPGSAGERGWLRWPGGGHGSPVGCKGKTKHHRCHVWASATNHYSAEGVWAGVAWCGLQTVRGKDWCSVISYYFYQHVFFLLFLSAVRPSFLLLFLCVFRLPISVLHSSSWPFIICHSNPPGFSFFLLKSLSLYLSVYLSVYL